ncbi:MAG: hypothetical protein QUS08_04890 [Methanothrix sp.]|nr:hypothetical protein [Methanothrix sp.]
MPQPRLIAEVVSFDDRDPLMARGGLPGDGALAGMITAGMITGSSPA